MEGATAWVLAQHGGKSNVCLVEGHLLSVNQEAVGLTFNSHSVHGFWRSLNVNISCTFQSKLSKSCFT